MNTCDQCASTALAWPHRGQFMLSPLERWATPIQVPQSLHTMASGTPPTFATANASHPHVSAGRVIALAVTSAQPSPVAPGLPTMAAAGGPTLAGYESAATIGILSRAGTPSAVVNFLHREIARYLHTANARERLLRAGIEAVGNTPEEFAAIIRDDMARKGKIIRDAGIRME